MGMIVVGPSKTYSLEEFCKEQSDRIKSLDSKLVDFRNLLRDTVFTACKKTFSGANFSADSYSQELEALRRGRRGEGDTEQQPVSFIEQANKRKECDRLVVFIMMVDLMLNSVLHQVVVNSMTTIQEAIQHRLQGAEEAKQKARGGTKKKMQGKGGTSGEGTGGQTGPPALFVTEVCIN